MKSITVDMDQHFSFWPVELTNVDALRPTIINGVAEQKMCIRVTNQWWDEYTKCDAQHAIFRSQLETMYRLQNGLDADKAELVGIAEVTPPPDLATYLSSDFVVNQTWLDGEEFYRSSTCATIEILINDEISADNLGYAQSLVLSSIRKHGSYACVYAAAALALHVSDMKKAGIEVDPRIHLRTVIGEGISSVKYAALLFTDIKATKKPMPMAVKRALRDALVRFSAADVTSTILPPGCRSVAEMYQFIHPKATSVDQSRLFKAIISGTVAPHCSSLTN